MFIGYAGNRLGRYGLWAVLPSIREAPDRLPAGLAGSGRADEETTRASKIKVHAPIF